MIGPLLQKPRAYCAVVHYKKLLKIFLRNFFRVKQTNKYWKQILHEKKGDSSSFLNKFVNTKSEHRDKYIEANVFPYL